MAKTTIIFIALFIISSTAGIVNHISYRSSLKSWKQAVANRDQKLSECQQQVASKSTTEPTKCPTIPAQIASEPTVIKHDQAVETDTLQIDRELAINIEAALDRLVAATTSGVNQARYSILLEDLTLAIQQKQIPLAHPAYKAAINESINCFYQAGKLWTGCLQKYEPCRDITGWAIRTYNMPFKDTDGVSIFTAELHMKDTLSFLWNIASQRLADAKAMQ